MTQNDQKIDEDLQKKLEEAQNQAQEKQEKQENDSEAQTIQQLNDKIAETEQIAKKAQFDYINLKMDFDGYVKRQEDNAANQKRETLFSVVKKFLPFVESLRKSIEILPADQHEEPMAKGVILTYNKFLQSLETMGIKPIEALGQNPDSLLHEPVSMQPTEDEAMKGKIVQEFERGFIYEKDGEKKVITTSKVVVGQ